MKTLLQINPGGRMSVQPEKRFLVNRFSDSQRFLLLCICAGVICGLVGVSFHLAITSVFDGLFGWFSGFGAWTVPAMILAPAFAGLLVGLLIRYVAPTAGGSGIPQTKVAYYQTFGVIRTSEAVWRFIIGTLSVGFGNSLGREGPTVHICSAFSSKLGRAFGLGKLRVQAMVPVALTI
jgi:chloride channel protein, CIC family